MSTEKIKKFNNITKSFLLQMAPYVGTSYHYYFNQMLRVNCLKPIKYYIEFAIPVRDQILNEDEQFFLNYKNYENYVDKEGKKFIELLRLKHVWNDIDPDSKLNIWKIFQALLILSEDYVKFKVKHL